MVFKINPYIGVGQILFGMTSLEIENLLNIKPYKFKKTEDDVNETDDFKNLHVFYNDDKKCNAIEIFNYPNVIVTINNKNLFKDSYENVEKYLKKLDNNLIYESCGILSEKFGINLYAPFLKENPNEEIDAILIFEKNYFSKTI